MVINYYNQDNMRFIFPEDIRVDYIYADPVYEDMNFEGWIKKYWELLKPNGIFCIQTDWHTCPDYWKFMRDSMRVTLVSHYVWKNEWGNHPKNKPHQCFDDILIFCKGDNWKFYPDRIQVDKVTKNKGLNPSGRTTKTATAWVDDVCLTTTSKERVKMADGHLIRWQKPIKLFDRITLPYTDEGDTIIDPFMGSGTLAVWCKQNNREYVGFENNKDVFYLADERIKNTEISDTIQQKQLSFL
jgi:DNA modification methylase